MRAVRKGRFQSLRLLAVAAVAVVPLAAMPGLAAASVPFGFESVEASESTAAAGMHPDFRTRFVLNTESNGSGGYVELGSPSLENIGVEAPAGLAGNLAKFPTCDMGTFMAAFSPCPTDSQIGTNRVKRTSAPAASSGTLYPLYNLAPGPDEVGRFGFNQFGIQVVIDVKVRASDGYRVEARINGAPAANPIDVETVLWGMPAASSHDEQRRTTAEALIFCPETDSACLVGGSRESGLKPPKPLMNNPAACEEQQVRFEATGYGVTAPPSVASAELPPIVECDKTPFAPSLRIEPTSREAGAPTGLTAVLRIPQTDMPDLPASSPLRDAKVTLPAGMTISPGAAAGLAACSDQQVGMGADGRPEEVAQACPDAAKLGSAEFISPALSEPLHGAVYQRTPAEGDLFRVWLVTDERGIHLKLPGEVKADPATGQLTMEFSEAPQLPVEELKIELKGGPTAPLKNPGSCGSYSASYQLTPWSGNPAVSGETPPFTLDQGCGSSGFAPKLQAGVANPVAGDYSPLIVDLSRKDGEDNLSGFDLTLPEGQLAKLAGVPLCSDADAATGGCRAGSQIGAVTVATGTGSQPLWIPQPGKASTGVYLAGAYKGAPYSIVTKVPAQAGPFDLGTVAVRGGLYVNPDTTQATVKTDSLPQILQGVPVLYRDIHVSINRPEFALNPTDCHEQLVTSTVTAAGGAVSAPADRYQVGECAALKFRPTLKLSLKGGTKRGRYPALRATLKTHGKEANIGAVSVALPHSEFLAQQHIRTICTRVQFAAGACPAGSVYGWAEAVTPLLDRPLQGPVYLRSSNNKLPDLVAALHGQLDVNLVGRIDSARGGIRTTFAAVPDAPVTKFVLKMNGGRKGLLVNSTDICRGKSRAAVRMDGQNGMTHDTGPLLRVSCGGSGRTG
jgi:hypothetical protein